MKREKGLREEEIEQRDAHKRGQHAAGVAPCEQRRQQHAEDVDGDDIRFGKAEPVKQHSHGRRRREDQQGDQDILRVRDQLMEKRLRGGGLFRADGVVRDDMDIQIRGELRQLFRQRRFAPEMSSRVIASADHDLRHPGDAGKFRDLERNVVAVNGGDGRAALLRQPDVIFQPFFVRLLHSVRVRRFYVKGGKRTAERGSHPRGRPDDLRVGRGGGETGQRMLGLTVRRALMFHADHAPFAVSSYAYPFYRFYLEISIAYSVG